MDRSDVRELHYIAHVDNLSSIMQRGILCKKAVGGLAHRSVANVEVQERRATRRIPGGLQVHEYVPLYFNARNAMLFRLLRDYDLAKRVPAEELAVLRLSSAVLDLPDIIVTDMNAAARAEPRWFPAEEGLLRLDHGEIFATYWRDRWHKQRMMAEVLVPRQVEVDHILRAYVVSDESATALSRMIPTLAVEVQARMFFR
ncbi:MAG: DUF4433 domain-containing protein [Acidimicrobiia bacterium]|nr:DUF4433 domain-containing protein [Acidimicrobiia bacterium]